MTEDLAAALEKARDTARRTRLLSVRLTAEEYERVKADARSHGMKAGTLARIVLLWWTENAPRAKARKRAVPR